MLPARSRQGVPLAQIGKQHSSWMTSETGWPRAARAAAKRILPVAVQDWLRVRVRGPAVGSVDFGSLRRTTPIARDFGYQRGGPIDRYYIEGFLERHDEDVHGRVLEIGERTYTTRFGGSRVTTSDVLHVKEGNPAATFVGDLAVGADLPSDAFDAIILTQTLHFIYDVRAAIRTLYRVLKPGGVLLLTVPGITQTDSGEWGETWYWAFTDRSMRRLLAEVFPPERVTIETHGNVLAAVALLHGLGAVELSRSELSHHDVDYALIITVRAVKPESSA